MSFNTDVLGLDEKPTEKVATKITKTRKAELDALVNAVQQGRPDATEEEIIEKLIGVGLDALKRKPAASSSRGTKKGQGADQSLSTSETSVG